MNISKYINNNVEVVFGSFGVKFQVVIKGTLLKSGGFYCVYASNDSSSSIKFAPEMVKEVKQGFNTTIYLEL